MKRRVFLSSLGAIAASQLLTSCNRSEQPSLRVRFLKGAIPAQLLEQFRRQLQQAERSPRFNFVLETRLQDAFQFLQDIKQADGETPSRWRLLTPWNQPANAQRLDWLMLGDAWLTQAIAQNLIQPINPSELTQWSQLPAAWRSLVQRNAQGQPDATGPVWGAPHRWGTTVIVYRADKFRERGWALPTDWADLWRSELRQEISLLDQPREVIGLTLKKLGQSYNVEDLAQVTNLKTELTSLHQQVKFYGSTDYLQPLLLGHTSVAVGWSTDVLPLLKRDRRIAAVVPRSGTALWADLWVRPAQPTSQSAIPPLSKAAIDWVNFYWDPTVAQQLSQVTLAASPLILEQRQNLPPELSNDAIRLPDPEILAKSEFLYPLPEKSALQYHQLWQEVRTLKG